MRIISQGGNADLPYEEIALCMACEDIIARHRDKEYLMARYSTMDKAQKAMEMLHEKYERYEIACSEYTVNWFDSPKIFKFPKDKDLEV